MARDFDGNNDRGILGTDASIDGFDPKSMGFWVRRRGTAQICLAAKDRAITGWALFIGANIGGNWLEFAQDWSTTNGNWTNTGDVALPDDGVDHHVTVTYDGAATTNDPVIEVDGVVQSLTENSTPAGSLVSDATQSLRIGETGAGGQDADMLFQHFSYGSGIWTAEQKNRHRWHGRIGGDVAVHHPFLTTKVENEGSGVADVALTGTTMASLPRGSRPGCGVF